MKNQSLLNKAFAALTSGIMVHLAILSFITAGLYAAKPLIFPIVIRFPDPFAHFMAVFYSLSNNPVTFAICCAIGGVCLSTSALIILVPLLNRNAAPTGKLIFQKITCIYACFLPIITFFVSISSASIDFGWETALLGYIVFIYYRVCVAVIALLFVMSGTNPSSYEDVILPVATY